MTSDSKPPATHDDMPHRIGPFHVLGDEPLGEGGMGTVYLAERREPVRQRAALKVIKLGMDTKEILARFDIERSAMAMMDHPNIVKVFEAGATVDGRPYFAMEYVAGLSITKYCDEHKLSIADRLKVFLQVCAGVEHAHHKGVVHRDLKPNNVLVADVDDSPAVKIIDFGLARATNYRLTDKTVFTRPGVLLGTEEYASPEQAGRGPDVDLRTDIYSLGVVLYELLTGTLPFSRSQLLAVPHDRMLEIIREEEPQKPSTKITTKQVDSDAVAHMRHTELPDLLARLRGDLDWVVLKCLHKDRNRRYQAVSALADDIQRYLSNRPVEARPHSGIYVLGKLAKQYRAQMILGSIAVVALFIGFGVATALWTKERQRAAAAEREANARAEEARRQSDQLRASNITVAEQKGVIEAQRTDLQRRVDTIARIARITRSTGVVDRLEIETHESLWPLTTVLLPQLRFWLERADTVLSQRPIIDAAISELRVLGTNDPSQDIPLVRHPASASLRRAEEQVASLEKARARRRGGPGVVETSALTGADAAHSAEGLSGRAWPRVAPTDAQRLRFGEETMAVKLAELAIEKAHSGDESEPLDSLFETLMWARFSVGDDARALEAAQESIACASPAMVSLRMRARDDLRAAIAAAEQTLTEARARRDALKGEIDAAVTLEFKDDVDQVLGSALFRLRRDTGALAAGPVPIVRRRLQWAETDAALLEHHAATWQAARRAIGGEDPKSAARYANLDLTPQPGLVPIGRNPSSNLWEFYHPRSAANSDAVPQPNADGSYHVTPETGLIFVLIPEGTFAMGAESTAEAQHRDSLAEANEQPVQTVRLRPFFLSRYEMTQAQWQRLTLGSNPSRYLAGTVDLRRPFVQTDPVENLTWEECDLWLSRHGFALPTEAQWEYACRAGTTTPWSCGAERHTLEGHANVSDQTARHQPWAQEPWNDGYLVHAPVGLFAPNPFGLHDMHGNVSEWTKDVMHTYSDVPAGPGDGLRATAHTPERFEYVHRGGNYSDPATKARSSHRGGYPPGTRAPILGVRPARALTM